MNMSIRSMLIWGGVAIVVLGSRAHAQPGISKTTVIRPGAPADGLPGFTYAGLAGENAINNNGTIIASAIITGPGISTSTNHVLVAGQPGTLTLIAREGDVISGLPGFIHAAASANISAFNNAAIADDDTILYEAQVREIGQITNLKAVIAGTIANPLPVMYTTGPVPGFDPADSLLTITEPSPLATGGRALILGRVQGTSSATAIWTGTNSGTIAALQTQMQAPGLPIPTIITSFESASLTMTDTGRITLQVTLSLGGGVTQSNRVVLYEGPPNLLEPVARTGDPVPGFPAATLTNIDRDTIRANDAGAMVWGGWVVGGGTDEVLITRGGGVSALLAKDGDPIPGFPGLTLDRVSRGRVEMNALGRVAFSAKIIGAPFTEDSAIFIGDANGFAMALREGTALPGGDILGDVGGAAFAFNARDQLVLFGTRVNSQNTRSVLVATTPSGTLVELARAGTFFTTNDGFSGVIADLNAWNQTFDSGSAQSGRYSVFNDNGQFIISMFFTGTTGSGVFLFDINDPCTPDLNNDGVLDNGDIGVFVAAFLGGDLAADFNSDGLLDNGDISAFVHAFLAGC